MLTECMTPSEVPVLVLHSCILHFLSVSGLEIFSQRLFGITAKSCSPTQFTSRSCKPPPQVTEHWNSQGQDEDLICILLSGQTKKLWVLSGNRMTWYVTDHVPVFGLPSGAGLQSASLCTVRPQCCVAAMRRRAVHETFTNAVSAAANALKDGNKYKNISC